MFDGLFDGEAHRAIIVLPDSHALVDARLVPLGGDVWRIEPDSGAGEHGVASGSGEVAVEAVADDVAADVGE